MGKYIDAEAFKEWIENWFYKHKSYHPYAKTNTIPVTELYDLLEQMPAADIPRWIPITEKLPEEICCSYWVCTDSGYQCECRWTNTNRFWPNLTTDWHWNIFDIPQYTTVVAWMPLPEPYKGGEEE